MDALDLSTLGVNLDDLRAPVKAALELAAGLGFRAVEMTTVSGDLAPSSLSASGRRHVRRLVEHHGLTLAALAADLPGLRLHDARTVDERVARTCQVVDLAVDLRVPVVSTSVSVLTNPANGAPMEMVLEALRRIGEHADARGVTFALRPTSEGGARLRRVLDDLRCSAIRVGLDPAAMVMAGINPVADFEQLAEQISLVHLRDGTAGTEIRGGHETRLGEGDVDLVGVLALLRTVEFQGPHILRRTTSDTPAADLEQARAAVERMGQWR